MGFHWPWRKDKKVVMVRPRRHRATAEELAERQKAKLGRQTALLKTQIEHARLEVELRRMQGVAVEDEPSDDPLDSATNQLKRLRRFEIAVGKHAPGEGPSKLEIFLNSAMGVAVVNALGPAGLQQLVAGVTGKLPPVDPAAVVTITANPQAVESAVPSAPVAAEGQFEGASEEPPSTPLFVQWAVSQLERKSPSGAAVWLVSLSQKREEARQLVELATGLTDEQIPAALTQVEQRYPNLAPLITWLRARPEWLLATVKEVRQAAQPAAAGSIMGL